MHPQLSIMVVPSSDVKTVVEYLNSVTREQLHEHYDPVKMAEQGVYKARADDGEERFNVIWDAFVNIRNLYRQAAAHNEAVIVRLE